MTNQKRLGNDFTAGNITQQLIHFMVPFLLANILTDLYNMVDMVIVGKFVGSTGLAAVTLGGKVLSMLTSVGIGLAAGGQVLISQQTGAHVPKSEINKTIGTMFSALFLAAIALGIFCFLLANPFLTLIHTQKESYDAALAYYRITCAGVPLVFGYNAVSSVMRGMGDSKRPLLFIAMAAIMNLFLDIVFVVCLRMGAAGTALATVIGQGMAFLFSVCYLYRRREQFGFDFRPISFRIDRKKLVIMGRIGVPMALQSLLIHGTQLIIIRAVNGLGVAATATYGILEKIITMTSVLTQSIRSAGGAIVAQNVGAGKYNRAEETLYVTLRITVCFAGILSVLSLLFPNVIFGFFTNDPDILEYSHASMKVAAISYFLSAVMGSYDMITTGTGNAKLSFLAGILDGVLFRLLFCYIFGVVLNQGVLGYYLGNSMARIGPIFVHTVYFYSGAWKRMKTLVDETNE